MAAGTIQLGTGADAQVGDRQVQSKSQQGEPGIDADKLQQFERLWENFGLGEADVPVAKDFVVFIAESAGTIRSVKAALSDTGTSTNVDFNILKNGSSILNDPVNITHSQTDGVLYSGTINDAPFVAGDVFRLTLAQTLNTGAHGPLMQVGIEYSTP